MANSTAKTGPGLILSLVTLTLGFVLAMAGMILGFNEISEAQTSAVHQAPGSLEQNFDAGLYDIYGESVDFRELIADDGLFSNEFDGSAITVRDPSGQLLVTTPSSPDLATNRGFTFYVHVGSFEVTEEGTHTIEVQTGEATTFVVGESWDTAWRDAIPWVILGLVGTVLVIAGLIMLILGVVRRQRAKNNQPPDSVTPGQFQAPASPPHSVPPQLYPTSNSPVPPSTASPSVPPSVSPPPPPPPTQNPSSF